MAGVHVGRRLRPMLAALAVGAATNLAGSVSAGPAAGSASPGSSAGAQSPDVVVIVTDDQHYRTLADMTQLRELVAAHGVRFTRAFVENSACCPSRATIMSGAHAHTTGVYSNAGPHGGVEAWQAS